MAKFKPEWEKRILHEPQEEAQMKPIGWGIIGCGNVTEVKSGPAFGKVPDSRLVAVMRRDAALAEDYARRHGVKKWYAEADALIADPEVTAVYVATPVGSHLEYALKVCAAGKPCYVEKPMARNAAEARLMVEAFKAAKLPLFVAYYRRGLARFRKVKELVESGAIGTLSGLSYRSASAHHQRTGELPWRFNAELSGGGLVMDVGCHTLDILDFVAGPLTFEAGMAANVASAYAVEDSVVIQFRLPSGGLGAASWNFASAQSEETAVFFGTEGRITISTFGQEAVKLEKGKAVELFDLPHPQHVQSGLITTIVDELQGRGVCPSTGESALRTTVLLDRALEGYYGGRADAFWARPETWPGRIH
jgi:1,5-anhydro-D-fructose reductase (1,5-anhydro-D-mannitol-forming)